MRPLECLRERQSGAASPATRSHEAVEHVDCEHERIAELEPSSRVGPGSRPDHHAVRADVEQRSRIVERADPTGRLHGHAERRDLPNQLRAEGTAAGAVEVNEVEPPRARLDPARGERDRIASALDHVLVATPLEPHGAVTEDVDGGDHLDREVEPHIFAY